MADNYLEKKMEDLRLGKTASTAPHRRQAPGAGRICFDFPPRRVLVTGGCNGIGETITDTYLRAGCKVAVFDTDSDKGFATARDKGIRFYPVDISDKEALTAAFADLLKAWRDIDIIINGYSPDPALLLAQEWAQHKRHYPIPSDYGGRIINISSASIIPLLPQSLMISLSEFGITVNSIIPGRIHTSTPAELCLFLSLPVSAFINGADIPANGSARHARPSE